MGTKISALTALTGAGTATDDELPIVDTSAVVTKKISIAELLIGIGALPKAGGTMTGTITLPNNTYLLAATNTVGTRSLIGLDALNRVYIDSSGSNTLFGGNVFIPSGTILAFGDDTAIQLSATGVLEVNNKTAGTFRDLKVRDIILDGTNLAKSSTAFANGAAAAAGTLGNAPVAGNPTKWVPINDNGTVRYIPAW